MKEALLIIDVQNDYFVNGKYPLHEPIAVLKNINALEHYFLNQNLPIIYIQHINNAPNATFFLKNSLGSQLHKGLLLKNNSTIIIKEFPNSFLHTNLLTTLTELSVKRLVITGMMTHMCIDTTTRAAKDLGFDNILIHDATTTRELEFNHKKIAVDDVQHSYLAALTKFADIHSTEAYLSTYKQV
ncbi:isochorismatase family protein [Acinetobacter rathckeae]|uniref:isochorismatase family protein n=1 Tax=Acinetobacter rathckeae TaxID=2605272 RepID=UPI0018A3379B|nr:isochorismatase family protein [Acinetobacter rathckeae]MBF7688235.1 isochorismatase family protein [Acinetobacter rathckeae]MBF7695246.1 isochorismatase family protein [Acinetobacter rathckeae]